MMRRKFNYLIISIFVLGVLCSLPVNAATRTWDNDDADNRWDVAANWSNNKLPGASDTARIALTGADFCLFDNAIDTLINKLQVGWAKSDYTKILPGDMLMTGGILKYKAESHVGYRAEGKLDFQGGSLSGTHHLKVGDGVGGIGTLTATGRNHPGRRCRQQQTL